MSTPFAGKEVYRVRVRRDAAYNFESENARSQVYITWPTNTKR